MSKNTTRREVLKSGVALAGLLSLWAFRLVGAVGSD